MSKYICDHHKKCEDNNCPHIIEHKKGPSCGPTFCPQAAGEVRCVIVQGTILRWRTIDSLIRIARVAIVSIDDLYSDVWDRLQGMEDDEEMERWFSVDNLKETMNDPDDDTNETTKLRILEMVKDLELDGVGWLFIN